MKNTCSGTAFRQSPWILMILMILFLGSPCAFAQTWSASGSGQWTTGTNWTGGTSPANATATAVVIDDATASGNQTVTLDVSGAIFQVGSLSLNNSLGAGYTDTLLITSSSSSNVSQFKIGVAGGLAIGSGIGTVEIRLQPSTTSAYAILNTYSGGTVTLNTGGLLTLDNTTVSSGGTYVLSPMAISGGALSMIGNNSVGGVGNTVFGSAQTLSMSSGSITFDNNTAATTGRLQITGNFTATGGTIAANHYSGSANVIELYGTTNSIGSGVVFSNSGNLTLSLRATGAQTLTSGVDLPNLLVRNGATDTVTLTSAGQNVGAISFLSSASVLKLGSNLNTATLPTSTIAGYGIDANGYVLNVTSASAWSFGSTYNVNLTSSQSGGVIKAASFTFGSPTTASTVGANVALETTGGGGTTTYVGNTVFNAASTLSFTGSSTSSSAVGLQASSSAGNTIGNLQVGNGTTATYLALTTGPFTLQGNASVLTNSSLALNGRVHSIAGKLQGNGTIVVNSGSGITFTSTGGFSPGAAVGSTGVATTGTGSVGTLTFSGTTTGTAVTLISSSVSTFDIASASSFDSIAAGGNAFALNGTLNVNLLSGYAPTTVGQTWKLFTGLGVASTNNFTVVSSDANETFGFSIVGTDGILTLTSAIAVPEPSTWLLMALGAAALLLASRAARLRVDA